MVGQTPKVCQMLLQRLCQVAKPAQSLSSRYAKTSLSLFSYLLSYSSFLCSSSPHCQSSAPFLGHLPRQARTSSSRTFCPSSKVFHEVETEAGTLWCRHDYHHDVDGHRVNILFMSFVLSHKKKQKTVFRFGKKW